MLPKPLLLMLKKTKKKAKKIARAMTEPVQASSSSTAAVIDKLSSVLGHINPFDRAAAAAEPDKEKKSKGDESPVKTPDLIWLLDNTASSHRHPAPSDEARAPAPAPAEAEWIAEFTAAYFKTSTGEQLSTAVAEVSGAVGSASATETEEQKARVQWRIEERLAPFLNLIVREQACTLRVRGPGADSRHELAPSNHSGISVSELVLRGDYADGHVVAAEIVEPRCGKVLQGKTTFAAPTGWAVVSDIDDTIKKTLTRSSVGILQTTFVEEAECIAGMPELYKWVAEKLQRPVFWVGTPSFVTVLRGFLERILADDRIRERSTSALLHTIFTPSFTISATPITRRARSSCAVPPGRTSWASSPP